MPGNETVQIEVAIVFQNLQDTAIKRDLIDLNQALSDRPGIYRFLLNQFIDVHKSRHSCPQDVNMIQQLFQKLTDERTCFFVFKPILERFVQFQEVGVSNSNFLIRVLQSGLKINGISELDEQNLLLQSLEMQNTKHQTQKPLLSKTNVQIASKNEKDLSISDIAWATKSVNQIQKVQKPKPKIKDVKESQVQTDSMQESKSSLYIKKCFQQRKPQLTTYDQILQQVLEENSKRKIQKPKKAQKNYVKQRKEASELSQLSTSFQTLRTPFLVENLHMDEYEVPSFELVTKNFNELRKLVIKREIVKKQLLVQDLQSKFMVKPSFKQTQLQLETLQRCLMTKVTQLKNIKQKISMRILKLKTTPSKKVDTQALEQNRQIYLVKTIIIKKKIGLRLEQKKIMTQVMEHKIRILKLLEPTK